MTYSDADVYGWKYGDYITLYNIEQKGFLDSTHTAVAIGDGHMLRWAPTPSENIYNPLIDSVCSKF